MRQLEKRVRKLEESRSSGYPHIVFWSEGQIFADCLRKSPKLPNEDGRLLVHLCGVSGGHGSPVAKNPVDPEHAGEYAKAVAWSKGEDWEALP